MLLILETLEDQVGLLVFELFDAIVSTHVVELPDFVGHYELLGSILLFQRSILVSARMEHVCAQVQDRPFVDIAIFIILLILVIFDFVELQFSIIFYKLGYSLAESAVLGFDVGFDCRVFV